MTKEKFHITLSHGAGQRLDVFLASHLREFTRSQIQRLGAAPTVRLPGSGGANDIGSLCHRTIAILRQDRRRFVQKVSFVTTPGYLDGPGGRERAGLPRATGPYRVITQLGVYGFDEATCRMKLRGLHPGVSFEMAQAAASFEIDTDEWIETTPPPSEEELACLHEIDPLGMVLGK